MSRGRILVVDDDPLILRSLSELLRLEKYDVQTAASGLEALQTLKDHPVDIIVSDINMPEIDGFKLLQEVRSRYPEILPILVTGYGTIENAVEAMRQGAYDYVTKPLVDDEIKLILQRAMEQKRLRQENQDLRDRLDMKFKFDNIIGHDHQMQRIFETIRTIADTKATALITGESGTGKTMIARAIHHNSSRRNEKFIEVNCGALPETLLESELFGHVRGSFTGAFKDKTGKFQLADDGTIFLDEISTASKALQVKMLRVLEQREIVRPGSNTPIPVDVRVLAATNKNLLEEVSEGRFREDLYFRLKVVSLQLPPLRERASDIPLLVEAFLAELSERHGTDVRGVTPEVMHILQSQPWPGNVRELRNHIERCVALCEAVALEPVEHAPRDPEGHDPLADGALPAFSEARRDLVESFERRYLRRLLDAHGDNLSAAARAAKLDRAQLYRMLWRHGLRERGASEG